MTADTMDKPRVLVVEDEADLITMLRYNLEREGFVVDEATDGDEALRRVAEQPPDVMVLDWMLPVTSGLDVCRRMRRDAATAEVPILILTARGAEHDRIRGLDTGADDYMVKPFSTPELMARLRALLRRAKPARDKEALAYDDIEMDLSGHRVTRAGRPLHLGPTEFRLLRFFLENPGRVFSRETLLKAVWGPDIFVEPRTVDVHIRRLRKVLKTAGRRDPIRTVRAAGYALDTSDTDDSGMAHA